MRYIEGIIVEAMQSNRPVSERLVWMWFASRSEKQSIITAPLSEIMAELHLCKITVLNAITALEADGIISCDRKHAQVTTYHLHTGETGVRS